MKKENYTAREVLEERLKMYEEKGIEKPKFTILEESKNYLLLGVERKDEFKNLVLFKGIINGREIVEVYLDCDHRGKINKAEVNWSAFGSVSPEEALEYALQIKEAAEFAARINGKDYGDKF